MKNEQNGQALIEFIIILPIVILLIFSFVDLGRILLEYNRLENLTNIVINKYDEINNSSELNEYLKSLGYENVNGLVSIKDDLLSIKLIKNVELYTPGLGKIISNPHEIKVERVVNYGE